MYIGNKIQEHREKNRLSQEMLAEKLGVSRQSVSKWELNQALPEIDKVVAMSKIFKVTTDELLIEPQSVEIRVFKPEKYEDANKIIELLQQNITVVLNCEEINEEIATQIKNKIMNDIADVIIEQVSYKTVVCCLPGYTVQSFPSPFRP